MAVARPILLSGVRRGGCMSVGPGGMPITDGEFRRQLLEPHRRPAEAV